MLWLLRLRYSLGCMKLVMEWLSGIGGGLELENMIE